MRVSYFLWARIAKRLLYRSAFQVGTGFTVWSVVGRLSKSAQSLETLAEYAGAEPLFAVASSQQSVTGLLGSVRIARQYGPSFVVDLDGMFDSVRPVFWITQAE